MRGAAGSTTPLIRLLICNKHRMFRAGLRLLIEANKGIIVVGEADSPAAMLKLAQGERPDIILLDDDLCQNTPDTLWTALRVSVPSARVLLLIDVGERHLPEVLVRNLGFATVSKADTTEALLSAIRQLHFRPSGGATEESPGESGPSSDPDTADDRQPRLVNTVTLLQGTHIADTRVVEVLQAINDDLRKSESIERLARRVGIGGSRLRHLFREYIGKSVGQFRRKRRLEVAAHLLVSGYQRISEIAYEIGFSDVRYFNKEFRRRFGVSPTSYRQANALSA
jgi:AraC-like DNA-binding protein